MMFKKDESAPNTGAVSRELFNYVLLPAHQRRVMAGCRDCNPDPDPGIGPPPPGAYTGVISPFHDLNG